MTPRRRSWRASIIGASFVTSKRGGSPTVFDRMLATRCGVAAVDYVHEGKFGYMPALHGDKIVPVALKDASGVNRTVDLDLWKLASVFY